MSIFGENELNAAQLQAVHHDGGPLLLLAGAGSGKTRVITYRLAELLRRGADPERIMAVTFTNKAAGELRGRTEKLVAETFGPADPAEAELPWPLRPPRPRVPRWIGTFHSIGARLLRRLARHAGLPQDFVILDEDDQLKLCKQLCEEFRLDELAMPPRALRAAIDRAKNQCILPDTYRGHDYFTDLVAKLYARYQARLLELGAADFGDLLLWPVVLCEREPELRLALSSRFQHVLVDEFQDVNTVQYRLLLHLAERSRNLVVVGDDDQAIYGWRGANVRILLDFERDWPDARVIKLEENYRSSQVILDAAHAVVTRNPERRDKRLFTRREGGELILCHQAQDERHEAAFVVQTLLYLQAEEGYEPADFAVIYRTNAQSRVLEEALRAVDAPYTVVGGMRFYDRAEVKDILAYLRLCHNPADELALRRVINVPARGIGPSTVGKLEAHARLGGIPLWQALQNALHDEEIVSAGPRRKLQTFVDLIEQLRELAGRQSLSELAKQVVQRSGYLHMLRPDEPEDESRLENVQELLGSIEEQEREAAELVARYAAEQAVPSGRPAAAAPEEPHAALFAEDEAPHLLTLPDYLTRVALQSGDDSAGGSRGIQLMTAHAAKGLEFKVVFITGLEDGLFPSLRPGTMESEEALLLRLSEERRLAYVALTRARERLVLSYAYARRLYGGQPRIALPSRFLGEIPAELLDRRGSQGGQSPWSSGSAYSRSGRPLGAGMQWPPGDEDSQGYEHQDPAYGARPRPRPQLDDGEQYVERDEASGFAAAISPSGPDDLAAAMFARGRRRPEPTRSPQRIGEVLSSMLGRPAAPAGRTAEAASSDGLRVEYDDGGGGFAIGQPVRHRQFGVGRVAAVSPQHGGALLTVRFASGEKKTIKAGFLTPVADSDAGDFGPDAQGD
jgi:DNA helicase-2/ATP-dependent DNA helicase PcrA